jgi:DNA-binding NarL/FixJ family response regulator
MRLGECADPVRVLVVEPDLFFAEFVADILREARPEFVVREVPSLSRALDHLFEAKGAELIITNVTVADDAGPPVAASLRRAAPDAAIFVLSATTDPDLVGECLRRGADRVLPRKKLTADSFLAAIRDVVGWSL